MANTEQNVRPPFLSRVLAGGLWISAAVAALFGLARGRQTEPEQLTNPDVRFEESDVSARGVILVVAGILLGTWIIVGLLYFVFAYYVRPVTRPQQIRISKEAVPLPPEPRLQAAPKRDWDAVRSAAIAELESYGWADRKQGTVTIPIERAIELLAQRGIPPQKAPPNVFFEPRAASRLTGLEQNVEQLP